MKLPESAPELRAPSFRVFCEWAGNLSPRWSLPSLVAPLTDTYSEVVGSMIVRTCATLLAGKPPFCACVRTVSSSGAM